ncbi:hypothetical protein WME99_47810 [Sorangium sp. So ce136]|uniref:hypothetical protein n=1 Tax=Sorangium sp. So ce136 TaxID=3133284 RepID=UPI003F0181FF
MYRSIPLFIIGAVVSSALVNSSDAAALNQRVSGTNCSYGNGSTTSALISIGNAIFNQSTTSAETISCPVTDDDRFRKQDITTLNVHGYNGSTTGVAVEASTCVVFFGATGEACSASVSSTANGNYTLSPPTTVWSSAHSSDFGFIRVKLPAKGGATASSVRGYYTAS